LLGRSLLWNLVKPCAWAWSSDDCMLLLLLSREREIRSGAAKGAEECNPGS
jgi:hypothetical protein